MAALPHHPAQQSVMKPGGFYNANSGMQQQAISKAQELILKAVQELPLPGVTLSDSTGKLPLGILDCGCSQGMNSMIAIKYVLEALHGRLHSSLLTSTAAVGSGSGESPPVSGTRDCRQGEGDSVCSSRTTNCQQGTGALAWQQDPEQQPAALEVVVTHEDLPDNDFSCVMKLLVDPSSSYARVETDHDHGGSAEAGVAYFSLPHPPDCATPPHAADSACDRASAVTVAVNCMDAPGANTATPPPNSQQRSMHVFSACVGRSFYDRLVPSASQSLVLAFTCLHWMRDKPVKCMDSLMPCLSADAGVLAALEGAWVDGFKRFLRLRAAEARPGAMLLAHFPSRTPDHITGHALAGINTAGVQSAAAASTAQHAAARTANTGASPAGPARTVTGVAREHWPFTKATQAMVSEGLLSPTDVAEMASCDFILPPWRVQEVLRSAEVAAQWEVRYCDTQPVTHPVWVAYQAGEATTEEAAATFRVMFQAVYEPSYISGLKASRRAAAAAAAAKGNTDSQQQASAEALVAQLFERVEAAYAAAPVPIIFDYIYIWLQRKF